MSFSKFIALAAIVLLSACSGSKGSASYDYAKIRKMAQQSEASSQFIAAHDEFVLIPKEALGDSHRLIIYPDGVSSYKAAIFQLSPAEYPGTELTLQAMRHGASGYEGEKYVGVWIDGNIAKLYPVSEDAVLTVSKPAISRDFLPELAIMTLTKDKPVKGLQISKPAKQAHAQLDQYLAVQSNKNDLITELEDLKKIFAQTPLMSMHERRSDIGLGEQLLLMVWDDGYANPALTSVDNQFSQILMASNFSNQPQLISVPNTKEIRLHPGQTSGTDSRVRQTQIALEGVIIPAKTSAILVRSDKTQ